MRHAVLALVVFAALSAPAAAQTYTPPASTGAPGGFRVFGLFDGSQMAASESFKAAFGSAQTNGYGVGAEVDVWKHVFLRIAATSSTRDGSRVFVDGGEVFDLHIPLSVKMTPIEAGGGWRTTAGRLAPYLGGAFISLAYEEVSDLGGASESSSFHERYTGGAVFGGVDVAIVKWLFVGGEAQYRHVPVPDVNGTLMHEFDETNLGGFTVRARVGVAFGK